MTVHTTHSRRRKSSTISFIHGLSRSRPNLARSPLPPHSRGNRLIRASCNADSTPGFAGAQVEFLASAGLVTQIMEALYGIKDIVHEAKDLAISLRSFERVLILIDNALRRYASTHIDETLTCGVRQELVQCHLSLDQFSENMNACRKAFPGRISCLWPRVVFAASDEAGFSKTRLSNHQSKLALLLVSLNSHRLIDLGSVQINEIKMHLHASMNRLSSVRRIRDNTIDVVDPLGDTLPVATSFCRAWEDFHYILKGYCRNRIGQAYIEQGDYQLIRPQSEQVIQPSDFSQVVQEGETLEISIVLRPSMENDEQRRCPKCYRMHSSGSIYGGWIICFHCSHRFRANRFIQARQKNQLSDAKFFRRITLEVHADEYYLEIRCYLQKLERSTMPSFKPINSQDEINWDIRTKLIDFMIKIHRSFRLRPETLYLAVNVVDRYSFRNAVYDEDYRLVGCAAIWIAAKKEDVGCLSLSELIQACNYDYSKSEFVKTEADILQTIQWMLEYPSAFLWFSLLTCYTWNSELKHLGWFLMELTLYDHEFIQYTPSSIASGSLTVARLLLDRSYQLQGPRKEPLQVAQALDTYLAKNFNDLPETLVKKYSISCYSNASDLVIEYYSMGG